MVGSVASQIGKGVFPPPSKHGSELPPLSPLWWVERLPKLGSLSTQRLIDSGSNPLKSPAMRSSRSDEAPASGGRLDTLPTSLDELKHLPVETYAELAALLPAILDVACNGEL